MRVCTTRGGWFLCREQRDLMVIAHQAGLKSENWQEVSMLEDLPCLVHYMDYDHGPEFFNVTVDDALELLRAAKKGN